MNKVILSIFAGAFMSVSAFAQIPNAGFENWSTVSTYQNPDGWDNLNSMTSSMSVYTCTKGTPGSPGASYIKLVSKAVSMMGIMPGVAVSGVISMSTYQPVSGFAFTQRPQSLAGNWQYMASGSDAGYVAAYLTKWNTSLMKRDTIAMINQTLSGMKMSWTAFSIDFMYMSGAYPDSAMITLSASGPVPVANSYLYVDNLAFTGSVASVKENKMNMDVKLFPNPVSEKLAINFSDTKATKGTLEIFDVIGNKVKAVNEADITSTYSLDVSDLDKGQYILKLTTSEGIIKRKFLKQ